ncbi:tyrosine-type recombinase/integrase [Parabacteroides merdae]|uniref:site-specific integrase n=1 Tax=Parabacteroides merdae TaxID=46503 RepID=UPI003D009261
MTKQVKVKEPVRIRTKKLANGNESIYLDLYKDGDRVYEFLKLYLISEKSKTDKEANRKTLELANAIKSKRIVELQNNEHGFKTNTTRSKMNLIQFVLHLADEQLAKSGNKRSYYYTLHSLAKHLDAYAGDKITFAKVNTEFVRGFIAYLRTAVNFNYENSKKKSKDEILSQNTQYNLYKKFTWVIRKAMLADIIVINPLDKVDNTDKPKPEEGQREFLTIEEIKKLMATPCKDDMLKRSFLFCCLVGLRYSDVKSLLWSDLREDNNGGIILRLRVIKTKRYEDFPVSREALKWLPEKTGSDENLIFTLSKNDNSNRKLKNWCASAGIKKKISFHCSRHTAATLNLSLGVPIETVSKLLGHTKISTTQIYAKIIDKNKKDAVRKQDGIFDF